MIELDQLLSGSATKEQVAEFFRHGEFYEESYLVAAIEKYLQTESQRQGIYDRRLSIEKILNGNYAGGHCQFVEQLLRQWNDWLGFENFHY